MSDCPKCGEPMTPGGFAIACGPGLTSTDIPLPDHCDNPECWRRRDEEAIADAIARGVIDP
jgi:hypothetical protein